MALFHGEEPDEPTSGFGPSPAPEPQLPELGAVNAGLFSRDGWWVKEESAPTVFHLPEDFPLVEAPPEQPPHVQIGESCPSCPDLGRCTSCGAIWAIVPGIEP